METYATGGNNRWGVGEPGRWDAGDEIAEAGASHYTKASLVTHQPHLRGFQVAKRFAQQTVDRKSWKVSAAAPTASLVYYRRAIFTALAVLLLAAFIALLVWIWQGRTRPWSLLVATVPEYDRLYLPSPSFAEQDQAAIAAMAQPRDFRLQSQSTLTELLASLKSAAEPGKQPDTSPLLVWVSAHGISQGDQAWLLESDFSPLRQMESGATDRIALADLLAAIGNHPAEKKVLILDSGPIERDVQLGIAVNLFPEMLARDLENEKFNRGGDFWVLHSHEVLEHSHAEPAGRRSVFSYYLEASLHSASANADVVNEIQVPGARNDSRISLAELASFVQRQVSAHVYAASGKARTQTPALIRAGKGAGRGRFDWDQPDSAQLADLSRIVMTIAPQVPPKEESSAAQEGAEEKAKSAGKEPEKTTQRGVLRKSSQLSMLALRAQEGAKEQEKEVKDQESGRAEATEKESGPGEADKSSEVDKTKSKSSKESPAKKPGGPATPATPRKLEELKGALGKYVKDLQKVEQKYGRAAEGSPDEWSAADYAPQHWRKIETYLLRNQQQILEEALTGTAAGDSAAASASAQATDVQKSFAEAEAAVNDFRKYFQEKAVHWEQSSIADNALARKEFRGAIRLRNDVLDHLPAWIELTDRLSPDSSKVWTNKLESVLARLAVVRNTLERPRAVTPQGEIEAAGMTVIFEGNADREREACNLTRLKNEIDQLRQARDELRKALDQLLETGVLGSDGDVDPPVCDRLNLWETAQALRLSEQDFQTVLRHLQKQKAGPPALEVRTTPQMPTPAEREKVQAQVWERRLVWLHQQADLGKLVEGQLGVKGESPTDKLASPLAGAPARSMANFEAANSLCGQLRETYENLPGQVLKSLPNFLSKGAQECWKADSLLRFVPAGQANNLRLLAKQNPLASLKVPLTQPAILYSLRGPLDASGKLLVEQGAPLGVGLSWTEPTELRWEVGGSQAPPRGSELLLEFNEGQMEVTSRQGSRFAARKPIRLADDGSPWEPATKQLVLRVKAIPPAETDEEADVVPTAPVPLVLTLDVQAPEELKVEANTVLPSPRWLDVFVEGQPGTIDEQHVRPMKRVRHAPQGAMTQWNRYRVRPLAEENGFAQCLVHLSPFSRGTSEYSLTVASRSAADRNVTIRVIAFPLGGLPPQSWQDVRDAFRRPSGDLAPPKSLVVRPGAAGEVAIPLFPDPPAAPAAGAAAAPPPAPAPAGAPTPALSNGFACEIADAKDETWRQYIWVTARPQNPKHYLLPSVRYHPNRREIEATFRAADKSKVPLGSSTLRWHLLGDELDARQVPPADLAAGESLTAVAKLAAKEFNASRTIPIAIDCDDYPRALHFDVPIDGTEVARYALEPFVPLALQLEMEPKDPAKDKAWPKITEQNQFFKELGVVRVRLRADLPPPDFHGVDRFVFRISANANVKLPTPFYEERAFSVLLVKPEPETKGNFALQGKVEDLVSLIDFKDVDRSQKVVVSASLEAMKDGKPEKLRRPIEAALREFVIDQEPPRIEELRVVNRGKIAKDSTVTIEVDLSDAPRSGDDDSSSAVAMGGVKWSLKQPEDPTVALQDSKAAVPEDADAEALVEPGRPLRLDVKAAELGKMKVWVQATDRAGNVGEAEQISFDVVEPPTKKAIRTGIPILLDKDKEKKN